MQKNLLSQLYISFIQIKALLNLSWYEVKLKYTRTQLGPFWNVFTILITVSILSLVWSTLFKIDLVNFLPRLYIGLIIWNFISSMITGACSLTTGKYKSLINNSPLPISNFIFRELFIGFINFIHYLPLLIIILYISPYSFTLFGIIKSICGLILVFINLFWIIYFVSIVCSRFRDFQPLIESVMAAGTMLTPIVWDKLMLPNPNYAYLNPFTFFVESFRDPLLGLHVDYKVYLILLFFIILGFVLLSLIIKFKGDRVIFWSN